MNIMDWESRDQSLLGSDLFEGQESIHRDELLGFYCGLFIGHVADPEARLNSSSGGLTTWLLCYLLKSGRIDGVIHMKHGRRRSGPLFEYGISRSVEEIRDAAKTRYYPGEVSRVLNALGDGLDAGRYVFVGIPEIVAEVRLLASVRDEYRRMIPYCLGALRICGGGEWDTPVRPGSVG